MGKTIIAIVLIGLIGLFGVQLLGMAKESTNESQSFDSVVKTYEAFKQSKDEQDLEASKQACETYLATYTEDDSSEHYQTVSEYLKTLKDYQKELAKKEAKNNAFSSFVSNYSSMDDYIFKSVAIEDEFDEFGYRTGNKIIVSKSHQGTYTSTSSVTNKTFDWYLKISEDGLRFIINENNIVLSSYPETVSVNCKGPTGNVISQDSAIRNKYADYSEVYVQAFDGEQDNTELYAYMTGMTASELANLGINGIEKVDDLYDFRTFILYGILDDGIRIIISNSNGSYNLGEISNEEMNEICQASMDINSIREIARVGLTSRANAEALVNAYKQKHPFWYEAFVEELIYGTN